MQVKPPNPILTLLTTFTQSAQEPTPESTQLSVLSTIKTIIMSNPNNYHHQHYGRVTFVQIYEFVVECLSYQYNENVLRVLLYVLAVMVKFWVQDSHDIRRLYDGILTLVQQRMYCGENCMRFFAVLVETMQESYYNYYCGTNNNNSMLHHTTYNSLNKYSMMPVARTNMQNYFMYHLLNQMLAFSNIFLDKCVVRNNNKEFNNNSGKKGNRNSQDSSRMRSSRASSKSFGNQRPYKYSGDGYAQESLSDELSSSEHEQQLYTLCQPQPVILSILSLIRVCLSYDFSHTARYHQQSEYQPTKSPIILPTKYSKHCRFGQYDIFLKNENTTQMLNYLYLISTNIKIKLQVLQILKSMSRIHFRYFKNKTFHKLHLEDIGYTVYNLLTGLDLNQPMSVCISGNIKVTSMDRCSKVSIGILLAEIVSILFYHQPTFYLVEMELIDWLIDKVGVFVVQELLQEEYFFAQRTSPNKIFSKEDLSLLIQYFIGQLPKLADYCKIYLRSNEQILEKVNQMYIRIGQKYYEILCQSIAQGPPLKTSAQDQSYEKYGLNRNQIYESSIMERSGLEESSKKFINLPEDKQGDQGSNSRCIAESDKQQTQTNVIPIIKNPQNNQQTSLNQQQQNIKQTKIPISIIQHEQQNYCLILSLVRQTGSVNSIRNILNIFRVYCPQYVQFDIIHNNMENKMRTVSSNLSYNETKNQPLTPPPTQVPSDNLYKTGQYQKWMICWLCNFENHFHVTAGHSRQPQKWQIQLHYEMMLQLLADLQNSITLRKQPSSSQLSPHTQKQKLQEQRYSQLNECILTIALYICDKITYDCRISVQEYIQLVRLDALLFLQWLCCNVNNPERVGQAQKAKKYSNNFNLDFEIELQPILQLLTNINYHPYFYNYYKNRKQQEWKLELLNRCTESLYEFSHNLSLIYAGCKDKKKEVSFDTEKVYGKIIYLLLRNYVQSLELYCQFNKASSYPDQQKHKIIITNLTKIFLNSPQTLHLILQELNTEHGYNHRYKKQFMGLYLDIIRKKCIWVEQDQYGYFYQFLKQYEDGRRNMGELITMLECLAIVVQLDRKACWDGTQGISNIVSLYLDTTVTSLALNRQISNKQCNCYELLQPLLKLVHNTKKQRQEQLIQLVKQLKIHNICLQQLQLPQLSSIITLSLNILNIFNTNHSIQQQLTASIELQQQNSLIFVVECSVWMMEVVKNIRGIYQCGDSQVIKLESEIVQFVCSGYGANCSRYQGVLKHLEDLNNHSMHDIHNSSYSNEKMASIIQHNQQHVLTQIIYFILSKTTETAYIFPQNISSQIQKHQYLKVDNMIVIFTLYHHLLQALWKKNEDLVRKIVPNDIICDSLSFLGEKGVGWVVRKLEEWNVVVPVGQESIELSQFEQEFVSCNENQGDLPEVMQTHEQKNNEQAQQREMIATPNKNSINRRQNAQLQDEHKIVTIVPFQNQIDIVNSNNSSQLQKQDGNSDDRDDRNQRQPYPNQKVQLQCKEVDACKQQEKSFITCSPNQCRIISPNQYPSTKKSEKKSNDNIIQGVLDDI